METTCFITSRTKHDRTFRTAWRVQVEESELTDKQKNGRWYQVLASFITKVERWSIQSDMLLEGKQAPTHQEWGEKAKSQWPSCCTVIHTKFGTGVVIQFEGGSDLQGITVAGARKPKALTMGTWRKYGRKRGHGMAYLLAAQGMGLCGSPDSGRDICELEAVAYLAFGAYAEHTFAPTRALYNAIGAV
jgi:predicted secreted protein